ncbi:MAG TPA: L,D-transpeptidase [Candidatus Dormibacteraeota bacterium]
MELGSRRRGLLALCIAAMLGLLAVIMAESNVDSAQAYGSYQSQRSQLQTAVAQAQGQGYTAADLQPVTDRVAQLEAQPEPIWVGSRAPFYRDQSNAMAALRVALKDREQEVMGQARDQSGQALGAAKAALDADATLEVDKTDLDPLQSRYDALSKTFNAAAKIGDVRSVASDAKRLTDDATKLGAVQQAENDAVKAAATALEAKDANNIGAIRKEGKDALFNGRNDASVAAYENKGGRMPNWATINAAYNRLEKFAPKLDSSALDDVATGAAAVERYGGQVHSVLFDGLGPKHIIVSFIAQHVWAYENGKLVMDTPVTTGIRGDTAYGTDFGPMKILYRSHPFKFHSPWPQGSPHWYPDTTVQWTAFFTTSGEAFHDASWQPDSTLGPGSQFQSWTRSHGCIHLTYSEAQWVYGWADEGTPVDVYPGDGTPVDQQLSQMTTDNQGNPLNPA